MARGPFRFERRAKRSGFESDILIEKPVDGTRGDSSVNRKRRKSFPE
jgi:hypothetical protein